MSAKAWRIFVYAQIPWLLGFGTYDVITHEWWAMPLMFAGSGSSMYFGSRNAQYAARREQAAHRPDYAKIRRLELELGLRDPDPPLIGSGLGQTTGPFIRHTQPRPSADPRTIASQAGDKYVNKFREAQEAYAKWEVCPVCTRRHAGRCAG